ncbi:uncharacterized protein LOC131952381 [Physella acuta]|uniref:uncharacterized protein LOC131952381 n=1 Tax=Physella acuta TaxID=109671 RepID=UPI0027DB6D37|nr:uncharacterized protein LOC131952381 [Physella acuta]
MNSQMDSHVGQADSCDRSRCHQKPYDPTTSGHMFDWWRCCPDGAIVRPCPPPPAPPSTPPHCRLPPLQPEQFDWPLFEGPHKKTVDTNKCDDDCQVSEDFWPDKCRKKRKLLSYRPPWMPAMIPNQWGVVKYPPPYTHYCRERGKPIYFVHKV